MMTLEKFEQFENKSNDLFLSPESFVFIQGFSTKKLSRQELQDLRNQELNGEKSTSAEEDEKETYERPSLIQRILKLRISSVK
jgi:hypothetical protein